MEAKEIRERIKKIRKNLSESFGSPEAKRDAKNRISELMQELKAKK